MPAYEETAKSALRFLGVPIPPNLRFAERKMKRQADETTEAWVEAFEELEKIA